MKNNLKTLKKELANSKPNYKLLVYEQWTELFEAELRKMLWKNPPDWEVIGWCKAIKVVLGE